MSSSHGIDSLLGDALLLSGFGLLANKTCRHVFKLIGFLGKTWQT